MQKFWWDEKTLWQETLEILSESGKTFDDVIAICGKDFQITKEDFAKLSNVFYDNGYGEVMVAFDLLVVGRDFWLERHEYDGSEWWEFKKMPDYENLPIVPIYALTTQQARKNGVKSPGTSHTLAELQGGGLKA